jgi:hypothetical protein
MNWRVCGWKPSWRNFRHYPGICLQWVNETRKILFRAVGIHADIRTRFLTVTRQKCYPLNQVLVCPVLICALWRSGNMRALLKAQCVRSIQVKLITCLLVRETKHVYTTILQWDLRARHAECPWYHIGVVLRYLGSGLEESLWTPSGERGMCQAFQRFTTFHYQQNRYRNALRLPTFLAAILLLPSMQPVVNFCFRNIKIARRKNGLRNYLARSHIYTELPFHKQNVESVLIGNVLRKDYCLLGCDAL